MSLLVIYHLMEASDTEEFGVHAEPLGAPIGGSNELLDVGQEDNQVKISFTGHV